MNCLIRPFRHSSQSAPDLGREPHCLPEVRIVFDYPAAVGRLRRSAGRPEPSARPERRARRSLELDGAWCVPGRGSRAFLPNFFPGPRGGADRLCEGSLPPLYGEQKLPVICAADNARRYLGRDHQRRADRDACPVGRAFPSVGRRVTPGRSWLGRQWWTLHRIENRLRADDRRLSSMFAIFTRLTRAEAIPTVERIEGVPWRLRSETVSQRGGQRRLRAAAPGKLPGPLRRPFLFIILISFPRSGQAPEIRLERGRAVPVLGGRLRISAGVGDRSGSHFRRRGDRQHDEHSFGKSVTFAVGPCLRKCELAAPLSRRGKQG